MCRIALLLTIVFASAVTATADYAIRDGDTVVFLGDSITAARAYGKVVEMYTLLRFPDRKVRYINAGHGGDTAAGGLERLERDVFAHGATLLTVAYGINDIGWGGKADAEHRQKYLDSIRGIVQKCKEHHVRVFICSAAITAGDTDDGGFLQEMNDEGMKISKSMGEGAIDLQRTMRQILRRVREANAQTKDAKDKQTMHAPDGIHLNDLGQLAMGFAMIKGLGAPSEVSSVTIDAAGPTLTAGSGCKVSDLKKDEGGIEFKRLDEGLPLNMQPLWGLQFRFIPIPDEINRYMLTVKHLAPGRYDVIVDGRGVGTFSERDLASGVNLASSTADPWVPGGPWDAQAHLLKRVTDARDELRVTGVLEKEYLQAHPLREQAAGETADADRMLGTLQRTIVRPAPYHFVIKPAAKK